MIKQLTIDALITLLQKMPTGTEVLEVMTEAEYPDNPEMMCKYVGMTIKFKVPDKT